MIQNFVHHFYKRFQIIKRESEIEHILLKTDSLIVLDRFSLRKILKK
jgi:hypothetical protein